METGVAMTIVKGAAGAVVVLVVLVAVLVLTHWGPMAGADDTDQCAKPVSERTGGWFCYEPDPR
jgi:hypothetical protein